MAGSDDTTTPTATSATSGAAALVRLVLGDPPRPLPADEAARYYLRSYVAMRTVVGALGLAVPIVLVLGEAVISGWSRITVRGSLSAYYHSPMQDFFVASLCVIAFLLMTYMAGHTRTRDFWFSLVAGVALLGVVFFPTWRDHGVEKGYCGDPGPAPSGCSPIEQAWGEATVAHVHQAFAIAFIVMLAFMSFLFARDEEVVQGNATMRTVQIWFGVLILLSGLYAIVGWSPGVDKLWLGEVGAVTFFALSWLFKGVRLGELAARRLRVRNDLA